MGNKPLKKCEIRLKLTKNCINTTYEEPVVKWVTFKGETPANIFDAGETEKKEKIYIGRGQIKMKFFSRSKIFHSWSVFS